MYTTSATTAAVGRQLREPGPELRRLPRDRDPQHHPQRARRVGVEGVHRVPLHRRRPRVPRLQRRRHGADHERRLRIVPRPRGPTRAGRRRPGEDRQPGQPSDTQGATTTVGSAIRWLRRPPTARSAGRTTRPRSRAGSGLRPLSAVHSPTPKYGGPTARPARTRASTRSSTSRRSRRSSSPRALHRVPATRCLRPRHSAQVLDQVTSGNHHHHDPRRGRHALPRLPRNAR